MSLESAVFALLNVPGVTTAMSGQSRIYASDRLPQEVALPAINFWTAADGGDEYDCEGRTGVVNAIVQVDCWALTKASLIDLHDRVRSALSGFRGIAGGTTIQKCFLRDAPDIPEEEGQPTDPHYFHRAMDFEISYEA